MSQTGEAMASRLQQTQPLIVLGMHRSGTSLIVRLLSDLGIHMGSWLSRDAESVHFQRLNRRIFAAAGSNWAQVDGLIRLMESPVTLFKISLSAKGTLTITDSFAPMSKER